MELNGGAIALTGTRRKDSVDEFLDNFEWVVDPRKLFLGMSTVIKVALATALYCDGAKVFAGMMIASGVFHVGQMFCLWQKNPVVFNRGDTNNRCRMPKGMEIVFYSMLSTMAIMVSYAGMHMDTLAGRVAFPGFINSVFAMYGYAAYDEFNNHNQVMIDR